MEKTLYWRVIPDVAAISVHTAVTPSDEDWDAYLADVSQHTASLKGVLVYSESAGPSASQRARINQSYKDANADIRTAIMTGSRLVRGVVTAMSWTLAENIKSFSTMEFDAAVSFLELDDDSRLKVRVVLRQLARSAGIEIEAFADESGQFRQKYGKNNSK